MLALILALAVSVAMMLRRGHIPGTAAGPSRRIIGITIISFVAIMFHPTKLDTPFRGVHWAGRIAGALAAVAVAPAVMRRGVIDGVRRGGAVHHRTRVRQRQRLVVRSTFGVPWSNQMPEFRLGFGPSCSACRWPHW